MILHKENLDYKKHCKYVLGVYVQASEDKTKKNSYKPRSLYCLYLRPTANNQVGCDLLHLPTNRVVTRYDIKSVAITSVVIKQAHATAKSDKMPSGLK